MILFPLEGFCCFCPCQWRSFPGEYTVHTTGPQWRGEKKKKGLHLCGAGAFNIHMFSGPVSSRPNSVKSSPSGWCISWWQPSSVSQRSKPCLRSWNLLAKHMEHGLTCFYSNVWCAHACYFKPARAWASYKIGMCVKINCLNAMQYVRHVWFQMQAHN